MKISFKDFFNISDLDIKKKNIKVETSKSIEKNGSLFNDEWLTKSEWEKENGKFEHLFRAFQPKGNHNFNELGLLVFAFLHLPKEDEWLFVSAGVVKGWPESKIFNEINLEENQAKIEISEKYKPYFGRLIVNYKKKSQNRLIFIDTFLEQNPTIKELLPTIYSGEKFEGYDNVHLSYKKLKAIFNGDILPTYKEALENVKGVYCLTDKETGKLYIGSATGVEGVAQRWGNYLDSKHGGNKKLIALYKEEGEKYFEENFYFSIVEYFSLSYDDDKILKRENYWKKVFSTVKNGYNNN
ncbi:GIY-YIG nuclease family protein [Mycoplasma sp. CSL7491-lung]|uniref:GIY-YIG nuclease family protein n=1 Tax=Mycoplasma sp. CSL7491-lung TaxID=549718 RepID=UPI001C0FF512|nr:GIY-YIG nuclease family protein [Mycoplasma sp. CSL7491-lung]MBU4692829.1 GIY-YIG nuclease family protein [Mycoplasma sp. CSL7491-lung]